jgi:hypothetical protein
MMRCLVCDLETYDFAFCSDVCRSTYEALLQEQAQKAARAARAVCERQAVAGKHEIFSTYEMACAISQIRTAKFPHIHCQIFETGDGYAVTYD